MPHNNRQYFDRQLIVIVLCLAAFGTIVMYSASSPHAIANYHGSTFFLKRHLKALVIGIGLLFILSSINHRHLKYSAFFLVILSIVALIMGYIFSPKNEPARWLIYTQHSKMITISDFVRIALIIYTAYYLDKFKSEIQNFRKGLLPLLLFAGLIILLVAFQPDLSTAMVMTLTFTVLLFIGGAKITHLIALGMSGIPVLAYSVYHNPYQFKRLLSWLTPGADTLGANWQAMSSTIALGNGGFLGTGLGDSIMKHGYLPQAHTDFIFSVIGEELGFLFTAIILIIFLWFFIRGLHTARNAPDGFGIFLAIGIVLNVTIYFLINVAYVTGYLPVTGLPMPFISYGGSSTICTLASMGILLSISRSGNAGKQFVNRKYYGV